MSEARELTRALGGDWLHSYGTAPCPVCQSQGRKDQVALTLSDGRNGLLVNCKKSNCSFVDILKAAGVAPKRRNLGPVAGPAANQTGRSYTDVKSRYAQGVGRDREAGLGVNGEAQRVLEGTWAIPIARTRLT